MTDDKFGHRTLSVQNDAMFAVIGEAGKFDSSISPENSTFV